jgi:peptidoglycan/LPS O-acetylase OafA/YrhL
MGLDEPGVLDLHSIGGLGVMMFFSISGYLVASSWLADPHLPRFLARRLLRIWPALAAAVLFTLVLLGPILTTLSLPEYAVHPLVAGHLHSLRFVFHDDLATGVIVSNPYRGNINGPLWTIPLETRCYALLALVGACGLLARCRLLAAGFLLLAAAYAIVDARGETFLALSAETHVLRISFEYSLFFLAGALLRTCGIPVRPGRRLALVTATLILAVVAIAVHRPFLALLAAVPVSSILFGASALPLIKDAGRFGDFSYGIYLYSMPVQQALIWYAKGAWSWHALLAASLSIALLLAVASWHLVEKHALRLKPEPAEAADWTGRREALPISWALIAYLMLA